jgi:hypothetical protein
MSSWRVIADLAAARAGGLREISRKPKELWSRLRSRSGRIERPPTASAGTSSAECATSERPAPLTASSGHAPETLWEDGELDLCRGVWGGEPFPLLAAMPSSAQPSPETLARLQHAYALREELDPAWAVRPLRLQLHQERLTLLMEDPGGGVLVEAPGTALGDRVVSAPRDRHRYGGWSGSPARPHP